MVTSQPILILIRGIPGSGKSTLAKQIMKSPELKKLGLSFKNFEADHYFVDPITKEYKWDASLLGRAHNWCYQSTTSDLLENNSVIVSNTFIKPSTLTPYITFCENNGLKYFIIHCENSFKNLHDVPDDRVEQMAKSYVPVEGELSFKTITDFTNIIATISNTIQKGNYND